MGDGHIVENIRKDLDAGFAYVVSLLDGPRSIERVQERLLQELDDSSCVRLGDLRDFEEFLTPLLSPHPSLLAGPN